MSQLTVSDESESKLRICIERLLGGRITAMSRQVRWRPSWFVDVSCNGETLKVYVRGDRESDVVPFPELKREADVIRVLDEQGVPVPKIYGMCSDPVAIIMEACPGSRDVSTAGSMAEQRRVARQYIDAMVAMHKLPLKPFADIGIHVPEGAEAIALAGLQAYLPLYEKNKAAPEPLIEFAIRWLRNNVPQHRTQASFIAFDAGQFLVDEGKITALYDFEFSMIGDAMTDLATMAMRHSYEPTGDTMSALCEYYADVSGEPIDVSVIRYHHALFATVACMQFAGVVKNPKAGDPHDVYLEWDLALRRTLLNALGKNMGVTFAQPAALGKPQPQQSALQTMLGDMVSAIPVHDEQQQAAQASAIRLAEYARKLDQYGSQLDLLAMMDASQFVGNCSHIHELEKKLEEYVKVASPDQGTALLQYFSTQLDRRIQVFSDIGIGRSAIHIHADILD